MYSLVSVATPENSDATAIGAQANAPNNISVAVGDHRFLDVREIGIM